MPSITKGEQTAQRILAAGTDLFAQSGYAATSMRDIAEKSGLRAGAIYNHFASKQHLLMAILTGHMQALLQQGAEVRSLRDFVTFHITYHQDKTAEVFLSYMELRNLTPENLAQITAYRNAYETRLRDILIMGTQTGDFRLKDPSISAKAIIGMLASLSNWYQEGGRLALDELIEIYWNLTAQMVGLRNL